MVNNETIAAVVVLYNPDESVGNNILSYASSLDYLIVVDNSDHPSSSLSSLTELLTCKVEFIHFGKNMGIAKALNDGCRKAIEMGATWIMTMDQDSYFPDTEVVKYLALIPEFSTRNIQIAGPNHEQNTNFTAALEEVNSVITSGCIFQKTVFESVKGFKEFLFIDEVDHEFCYNAKSKGFRIFKCNQIVLEHQLGTRRKLNLGSKQFSRVLHNPQRIYFMVRNALYIKKHFGKTYPEELSIKTKDLLHRIKNNVLFGNHRLKTIRYIFKALIDAKTGRFGNPFS